LFENKLNLVSFMNEHGAIRILFKCLAENDNSKQQIYLGGSFEALNQLPFGDIKPDNIYGQMPNFKASLKFYWIDDDGSIERAPRAQLILYPKYPEVRLSGFLLGCRTAPRAHLQPVPVGERKYNNGRDGRVLVFGISDDDSIFAYLSLADTPLSNELIHIADDNSLFTPIDIQNRVNSRTAMLNVLSQIHLHGRVQGSRLDAQGNVISYNAVNAGGYTLEALLGVTPNGRAEPDWRGWEVKAFSGTRITLMTPEPDGGIYGDRGVGNFVLLYGNDVREGVRYFTGIHKCRDSNPKTRMRMILDGYDADANQITRIDSGLTLLDSNHQPAAIWTYSKLLEHWGRKHAKAVYVPYYRENIRNINHFSYGSSVLVGEGTDFNKFLAAFNNGYVVYDPASKLFVNERGNLQTKARNQFRINVNYLRELYNVFTNEELS